MAAEYEIKTAGNEHKQDLYNLLTSSFFTEMPLFKACNIEFPPSIDTWPIIQNLNNGLSLIAVCPQGQILGVAINVIPVKGVAVEGPVLLGKFWEFILNDSKGLVSELENTTIELRILAVAKGQRGKGIGRRLIMESENLAKNLGYKNVFAMSTGAYADALFGNRGWKPMYSLLYADYAKVDQEFNTPPKPHERFTLYENNLVD